MFGLFFKNHPRLFVPPLSVHNVFRALTGNFRIKPDFIIIGAQKCGTSSLFYYLSSHPFVKPSQKKEIRFFDRYGHLGLNWYKGNFPSYFEKKLFKIKNGQSFVTGEATSSYIFHPSVPKIISKQLPKVKIIAMLRNPVDRAYSHYNMIRRIGKENLDFEEAIEREKSRISGEENKITKNLNYFSIPLNYYAYLSHGLYVNYLKNWLKYFPKEQIQLSTMEELESNPMDVYKQFTRFLQIPDWSPSEFPKKNWGEYNKMNDKTRKRLVKFFENSNLELYQLLGRKFDWDS